MPIGSAGQRSTDNRAAIRNPGRYGFADEIKVTGATAALGASPGHDATCAADAPAERLSVGAFGPLPVSVGDRGTGQSTNAFSPAWRRTKPVPAGLSASCDLRLPWA